MPDRFTLGFERDVGRARGRRMGTLWADLEEGEGEVTINEVVDDNLLMRADLLKDWIGLLTREYDLTLEKMREVSNKRRQQKVIQFPGRA